MGDRKPKKNSSGNSDAHKAKQAKRSAEQDMTRLKDNERKNEGKK